MDEDGSASGSNKTPDVDPHSGAGGHQTQFGQFRGWLNGLGSFDVSTPRLFDRGVK
ncbi:hypothetical protein HK405_006937, partial [Cladochytrium tenue]